MQEDDAACNVCNTNFRKSDAWLLQGCIACTCQSGQPQWFCCCTSGIHRTLKTLTQVFVFQLKANIDDPHKWHWLENPVSVLHYRKQKFW